MDTNIVVDFYSALCNLLYTRFGVAFNILYELYTN